LVLSLLCNATSPTASSTLSLHDALPISSIAAFIFGVVLALFRVSPVRSLSWLSAAFINVVRNTPLTVLVVMSVLVLWGQLQINMHSNFEMNFFILATIALSVYHA